MVNTTFVGLQINNRLNWKNHIKLMIPKLNGACYAVRSMVRISDITTLKSIYFAYFHSIIKYGTIFWGNSSSSAKIFTLQKKIIRIFVDAQPRTSSSGLLNSLSILMNDEAKFETASEKYLYTHSFYSVDEFFLCVKMIMLYNTFIMFLHCKILYTLCILWIVPHPNVFMTCLWIHEMHNIWHVCMHACTYKLLTNVLTKQLHMYKHAMTIKNLDALDRVTSHFSCMSAEQSNIHPTSYLMVMVYFPNQLSA
jgi:hypothetical protein